MLRRFCLPLLSLLFTFPSVAKPPPLALTVFAAASLTNALQDIGRLWTGQGHAPVVFSFAASSTLAQQIAHGAPADIFASADEQWMDELAKQDRIVPETRSDLLGNSLVIVERRTQLKPIAIGPGQNLAPILLAILGPTGRLAVGDPSHVPAGIYAQQALEKLGAWPALRDHLAPADSVRSALLLVERGEVPAGIVYATDVRVSPDLAIAGVFPPDSHIPIRYPFAAIRHSTRPDALEFLTFLRTDAAQDVFKHYGFTAP